MRGTWLIFGAVQGYIPVPFKKWRQKIRVDRFKDHCLVHQVPTYWCDTGAIFVRLIAFLETSCEPWKYSAPGLNNYVFLSTQVHMHNRQVTFKVVLAGVRGSKVCQALQGASTDLAPVSTQVSGIKAGSQEREPRPVYLYRVQDQPRKSRPSSTSYAAQDLSHTHYVSNLYGIQISSEISCIPSKLNTTQMTGKQDERRLREGIKVARGWPCCPVGV